jgi:hypothetical protein
VLDADYSKNIIPRFRQRLTTKEKPFLSQKLSLAYSIILVLVIGYFLFVSEFNQESKTELTLQAISDDMDENELTDLIQFMNGESSYYDYSLSYLDIELTNLEELISQIPDGDSPLLTDFEIKDISSEISETEAENVFKTLAIKNF